jgi:hypothetical protein
LTTHHYRWCTTWQHAHRLGEQLLEGENNCNILQ